jgi:hypothetical protein
MQKFGTSAGAPDSATAAAAAAAAAVVAAAAAAGHFGLHPSHAALSAARGIGHVEETEGEVEEGAEGALELAGVRRLPKRVSEISLDASQVPREF